MATHRFDYRDADLHLR